MSDTEDMYRHLISKHGEYCIECGVRWREPSPSCPHREYNVHPIAILNPSRPSRTYPSMRALEARDRWLSTMSRGMPEGGLRHYPVTTICGPMCYYKQMIHVAERLTANRMIVLMPHMVGVGGSATKTMLDEMHLTKIDMSSSITVVGDHIGESTQREIEYATKTGKVVIHWTQYPESWT